MKLFFLLFSSSSSPLFSSLPTLFPTPHLFPYPLLIPPLPLLSSSSSPHQPPLFSTPAPSHLFYSLPFIISLSYSLPSFPSIPLIFLVLSAPPLFFTTSLNLSTPLLPLLCNTTIMYVLTIMLLYTYYHQFNTFKLVSPSKLAVVT